MHYSNVLSIFKIEWDTYEKLNKEDDPDVSVINDKGNDRKVIKWVYIFTDCLSQNYGYRGPLVYVLQESSASPSDVDYPLDTVSYHVGSVSRHEEMVAGLSHNGRIYNNDNK